MIKTLHRYSDFGDPRTISFGPPTGLEPTFGGMRYLDIPGTPSGPSPIAGWPQGLYLGMFRLYDSYNGVWLSNDPLGYVDSPNRSAYVGQNPISYIDPLGTDKRPAPSGKSDFVGPKITRKGGLPNYLADVVEVTAKPEPKGSSGWTSPLLNLPVWGPKEIIKQDATKVASTTAGDQTQESRRTPTKQLVNSSAPQKHINSQHEARKIGDYDYDDAVEGLHFVDAHYGREMARIIEKIYRLETRHFNSAGYHRTGSGGMEASTAKAPFYGWNPAYFPDGAVRGLWTAQDGKGLGSNQSGVKRFLVFSSVEAAMATKAEYIRHYEGNYARWYSTDPKRQAEYRAALSRIRSKIVDSF